MPGFGAGATATSLAIGKRQAEHGARVGQEGGQLGIAVLHQHHLAAAGAASDDAGAQGHTFAGAGGGGARFGLDLDLLGDVIEHADADVIEIEVLLDLARNLRQHPLGILAGNGGLGNVVQEGEIPRPALLFLEQTGILDGDGDLAGGGLQQFQVALLVHELAVKIHHRQHADGMVVDENRRRAITLGRDVGHESKPEAGADLLHVGADQQRLAAANHVLGHGVRGLARALGEDLALDRFEFKAQLVVGEEGDVKGLGVE